jgi:hypothetical protein
MGSVGNYQVSAVAKADGGLNAAQNFRTEVQGLAELEFEVRERQRVVDVDNTTAFQIRVKNIGTKEATRIQVVAEHSKNIKPIETSNGTDDHTEAKYNPAKQQIAFPPIDRLSPGEEVILGIKVQALEQGIARCEVFLLHDDASKPEDALKDMAAFKITVPRR